MTENDLGGYEYGDFERNQDDEDPYNPGRSTPEQATLSQAYCMRDGCGKQLSNDTDYSNANCAGCGNTVSGDCLKCPDGHVSHTTEGCYSTGY